MLAGQLSVAAQQRLAAAPELHCVPPPNSLQIIRGADNPFSRAAAKGEPTAHLLPAVAHDLDVLQQLSVTERTMATWCACLDVCCLRLWHVRAAGRAGMACSMCPDAFWCKSLCERG